MGGGTADQPNYYELLGVDTSASEAKIKTAYRALATSAHPDTGGNVALFRLVTLARDTLCDPRRRAEYDRSVGAVEQLDGLTEPVDLLALGQQESERGNLRRARAAFKAVIAANSSEWAALAWLGLAGVESDAQDLVAARRSYGRAIASCDPAVVSVALVGLGDVERELGHEAEARTAYHRAIGTGDDHMIPSALLSLAELEEAGGNVDLARSAYQLTVRAGDQEFARIAREALQSLNR